MAADARARRLCHALHGAGLPRLTLHELCMLAEVYTHSSASQRRAAVDALSTLLEGVS